MNGFLQGAHDIYQIEANSQNKGTSRKKEALSLNLKNPVVKI